MTSPKARSAVLFVLDLLQVSVAIAFLLLAIRTHHEHMIYVGLLGVFLLNLLRWYFRKERSDLSFLLLVTGIWYTGFWVIRDSVFGFHTPSSTLEDAISMYPLNVFLASLLLLPPRDRKNGCFEERPARTLIIAGIVGLVHLFATLIAGGTANELAVILLLALFIFRHAESDELFDIRHFGLISFGLFWYQSFIVLTYWFFPLPDDLLQYKIALCPIIFAATLNLIVERLISKPNAPESSWIKQP